MNLLLLGLIFCLIEVRAIVVAVQQPYLAECIAIFTVSIVRSWDKTPMTKCHCPKPQYKKCTPQPQNPNPQTHKSVAFHTLTFSPWHSDWIP